MGYIYEVVLQVCSCLGHREEAIKMQLTVQLIVHLA